MANIPLCDISRKPIYHCTHFKCVIRDFYRAKKIWNTVSSTCWEGDLANISANRNWMKFHRFAFFLKREMTISLDQSILCKVTEYEQPLDIPEVGVSWQAAHGSMNPVHSLLTLCRGRLYPFIMSGPSPPHHLSGGRDGRGYPLMCSFPILHFPWN